LEANAYKSEDVTSEFIDRVRRYFQEAIPAQKYYSAVAVLDNAVIGTAGVCFYEKPPTLAGGTGLVGYVTNVFVLNENRKQKVGTRLMYELNKLAKELKADKLHLGATSEGVKLYKSIGYREPRFTNLEIRTPFDQA
jgi:GNAT superfamily N-acetyltransferase